MLFYSIKEYGTENKAVIHSAHDDCVVGVLVFITCLFHYVYPAIMRMLVHMPWRNQALHLNWESIRIL